MKPSISLRGAQRFPMNSKQGNKDYYKGTRQSYAPGAGVRTGAPGVHDPRGGYRLLDDKVRVFVAPPKEVLDSTELRPYVDQSYFGRNHTIPNPYSGFEIFQRHAEMIASKLPDLRSRWQKILDSQPDVEGEGVEQIPVEEEEVLMIGSTDHPVPLEPVDTSIAGTHASSSTLPSSPSMSEPYPPPSTSTSIPSSTSLFEEDEEDDFDDPDRLPRDLQTQPSDLNALPEQTPIYEMTLTQLDSMQRGSAPSDIWTAELEERYQALYREHLLKPPAGSINPLYWDHWKSLSEEQKEAYKFVAKRIWWDVCAQRIREATR